MENKAMELEENVTVNEETKKVTTKKAAPVNKTAIGCPQTKL